jgi:hypothetical protein
MIVDCTHFAGLFFWWVSVLAFLATFCFGIWKPDFGDSGNTCYTRFRMGTGEPGLAVGEESGFVLMFGVYTGGGLFMAFSLSPNLFLAIVIDSGRAGPVERGFRRRGEGRSEFPGRGVWVLKLPPPLLRPRLGDVSGWSHKL